MVEPMNTGKDCMQEIESLFQYRNWSKSQGTVGMVGMRE